MAALIPLGLTALGAIPNLISGFMGIAENARKLRGGKLRKHVLRHMHKRPIRRRGGRVHKKRLVKSGRGVVADTLSNIPLLGAMLGPLARAFGGKLKKMPLRQRRLYAMKLLRQLRGKGLAPMYMQRPYVGMGLAPYGSKRSHGGYIPYTFKSGIRRSLAPMYMQRPYVGMGLLAPAGGAVVVRKGHLRKIPGRAARVRVAPTLAITGRGMHINKKKAHRK